MCPPASEFDLSAASGGLAAQIPVCVPSDTLSKAACSHAIEILQPTIFTHSVRVYLYAKAIAEREQSSWIKPENLPLLFAACILHDAGTATEHDGDQRFEVEGADAAAFILQSHSVTPDAVHEVWTAIALHTSPGIAERITPLARLVRLGVAIDFKRAAAMPSTSDGEVADLEARFPRGEIEKVLGDVVAEQGLRRPEKAPAASWPGNLVRGARENPGWEGVNKGF